MDRRLGRSRSPVSRVAALASARVAAYWEGKGKGKGKPDGSMMIWVKVGDDESGD